MKRCAGNKSRKAQIPSTVFIYALAAIIIAFILIFGYSAIGKLGSTASKTETAKFKTDIKNLIIEDTSYGKSDYITINIPMGYSELCFIATEDPDDSEFVQSDTTDKYPLAYDVAESPNNVFLADDEGNIDPFLVEDFSIEGDKTDICIPAQSGQLKFRIEGKGDHALIIPVN
ncbi:hypothetical protein GF345_06820 [Candidatus Woesearchaeota archaeon]|nr:hypothetical protein [Candidatus Woesearchaeota archaeon]